MITIIAMTVIISTNVNACPVLPLTGRPQTFCSDLIMF